MIKRHAIHRFRDTLLVMALLGQTIIRQIPRARLLSVVLVAGIAVTNVEGSDITSSSTIGADRIQDLTGSPRSVLL